MSYDPRYQRPGEDLGEWEDRLIYEANKAKSTVYAMDLLQFAFLLPGKRVPAPYKKAARDGDCFAWICDYWDYVKWNEHGNECNFFDAGGYGGFLDQILDPDAMNDTIEYLLPEGRIPGYERAIELADGLIALHERYAPAKSRNRRSRPSKPETKAGTNEKQGEHASVKMRTTCHTDSSYRNSPPGIATGLMGYLRSDARSESPVVRLGVIPASEYKNGSEKRRGCR